MKNFIKRIITLLAAFAMVLTYPVINIKAADDYPAKYKNSARDAIIDAWNFYNRECTSFCAYCLNTRNGIAFHNWYGGIRWGNAKNWGVAAKKLGIVVDKNPAKGSIAWWDGGDYGHVAWVAEVNGDNVAIEEYNYNYKGTYNSRTINKNNPTGYIHIQDMVEEHYIDLNWDLDGEETNVSVDYATVDVYINGSLVQSGATDYYQKWPVGTTYEFKNIIAKDGYVYNDVITGQLSGTLGNGDTEIRLGFSRVTQEKVEWKLTTTKTNKYCIIPAGFSTDNTLFSKYASSKVEDSEYGGLKIVTEKTEIVGYIYYHWTFVRGWLPNNNYNVFINDHYCWERNREYKYFTAFESTKDYGHTDSRGTYGGSDVYFRWRNNTSDGSWWWFRVPVYKQTYKVYELTGGMITEKELAGTVNEVFTLED